MMYTLVLETPDGTRHNCRLCADTPELADRRAKYIRSHAEHELLKQDGLTAEEAAERLHEKGHFIKWVSLEPDPA